MNVSNNQWAPAPRSSAPEGADKVGPLIITLQHIKSLFVTGTPVY